MAYQIFQIKRGCTFNCVKLCTQYIINKCSVGAVLCPTDAFRQKYRRY